jgi:hypothetical protein
VFCPIALAAVATKKRFPPQVLSRSIAIEMEKHSEGRDEVLPDDPQFIGARALISEWASKFERPEVCKVPFVGRDANNWQPLIEIGQVFGYGATAHAAALAIHRPSDDPVIRVFFDIRRVFEQHGIDRIWWNELLSALDQLPDAHWDEFLGLEENEKPHKLTHAELYSLLRTKRIKSRSVRKGRETNKGFLREQFEPVWHELFGDTPAQHSKIIRLPWHKQRHTGGTD